MKCCPCFRPRHLPQRWKPSVVATSNFAYDGGIPAQEAVRRADACACSQVEGSGARANDAVAIGQIGVRSVEVVDALAFGLADREASVRDQSAVTLGRLDPQRASRAIPVVVDSLIDWNRKNPNARQTLAQFALGNHLDLTATRGTLVGLSQNGSPEARAMAAEALQAIDAGAAAQPHGER
jgi:HEAT repeat protein